MEVILQNPYVLVAFGAVMAIGVLIIGITIALYKILTSARFGLTAPTLPALPGNCPFPCADHKAIAGKVEEMDGELDEISGRQKKLREDDLPEKFTPRREHDTCKRDRQAHETELFTRVGALERKQAAGGG